MIMTPKAEDSMRTDHGMISQILSAASLVAAVAVRWKSHIWFKDTGIK